MSSLLNAFNKLDVLLKLKLLTKYFNETNSDAGLKICNVELSTQSVNGNGAFRYFVTVTKRNVLNSGCDVKQEIELDIIIENLLLNYSRELFDEYSKEFTSEVELLNNKIETIALVKDEINEFKNRFNTHDFEKSVTIMKDVKHDILNQLSSLNFKKIILNSDSILENYSNYSYLLKDDENFKYVKQLIDLVDQWSSEGYVYYSSPNGIYNGLFFNVNNRMFWQTSMSSFCEEINLLLKNHLDDIRMPTKSLRHNSKDFVGYIVHFDDFKNWLLANN